MMEAWKSRESSETGQSVTKIQIMTTKYTVVAS